MDDIKYSLEGQVAVFQLDNPPLNPMSHGLRSGIARGLEKAAEDKVVKAIVIIGNDRAFCSGADISEFGTPKMTMEPNLNALIEAFEDSTKPIIAAISGACMGGGLETALGCHFRVAKPDASIALPEVKLGLLPGGGGTQRFPRLVGLEAALNMIVSGTPVPAAMLQSTKLIDEIIPGDLKAGAIAFAEKIIAEKRPLKRVRDMEIDYPQAEAFLQFAKNSVGAMSKNYPAPLKCIEAVEASLLPFEKGKAIEEDLFMQLMSSSESAALRHVFFAQRAASKIPDIPKDTPTRPIKNVAVIGAGTMGGGITMTFLSAGIPVTLVETNQEALDRGVGIIRKNYENTMKKGRISKEKFDKAMSLLTPTLSLEDVQLADLIVEAVFEDMGVKEEVFRKLDKIAKPGAILASNTSTLNIDKMASFTSRPQDVLGLHYFSPANVMKLIEIVRGDATAKDVMATAMAICKKTKKLGVVSGVCDGFITSRMIGKYMSQAQYLIQQGASPQQVDKALEKWGMVMGPFRVGDLTGQDIGWAIYERHLSENPNMKRNLLTDKMIELGRKGQKTGAGWYRYENSSRDPIHDPEIDKILQDCRRKEGIQPRKFTDEDIVEHCIYAFVNEGARILSEGIASKASDIDISNIFAFGFPAFRGGPMHYANKKGLYTVLRKIEGFKIEPGADKEFWEPSPLLVQLALESKQFD